VGSGDSLVSASNYGGMPRCARRGTLARQSPTPKARAPSDQ